MLKALTEKLARMGGIFSHNLLKLTRPNFKGFQQQFMRRVRVLSRCQHTCICQTKNISAMTDSMISGCVTFSNAESALLQ